MPRWRPIGEDDGEGAKESTPTAAAATPVAEGLPAIGAGGAIGAEVPEEGDTGDAGTGRDDAAESGAKSKGGGAEGEGNADHWQPPIGAPVDWTGAGDDDWVRGADEARKEEPARRKRGKKAQREAHAATEELVPAAAAAPAAPEPEDCASLAEQLRLTKQRVNARTVAVTGLRNEIRRLQHETAQAKREEASCHDDAHELLSSVGDRRDKHRDKHSEIDAEVALHVERAALRRAREREWREDLESATYQRVRAKEATDEVEVEAGRWHKAAAEQADRVKRAEAKLKALEARRTEHKSQSEKWHRQALASQKEGNEWRTQVQELRLEAQSVEAGALRQKQLWQAIAGVLLIVLTSLLLGGCAPLR